MDQTPGPSTEQPTEESSESAEEQLVLPHIHVRFQDDISSEVRRGASRI